LLKKILEEDGYIKKGVTMTTILTTRIVILAAMYGKMVSDTKSYRVRKNEHNQRLKFSHQ
jgi:hypothetical protein